MKIKYWLMISYLLVMLLPVAAAYLLYVSLSDYDDKQDITDFLQFQDVANNLEDVLNDVSLYTIQSEENYEPLKRYTNENLKIDLYRYDGIHLYSSMTPSSATQLYKPNKDVLFQNLNEYQKNPRTYSLKRLVFDEQEQLAGLYEITMSRQAWIDASNKSTTMMVVLLSTFFLALYVIVIIAINKKLNRPLNQLQHHMTAFAAGKELDQRLQPSRDEIGVLIEHFEQMKAQILETREKLAKQQREKEYMVASLSHDLKTPLTVIRTYTEALESHHLTQEEREEYQQILYEKLEHMKEMINDLSVFTALQSAENTLRRVPVNGNEFFDMLFSGYEEACAKKNIHLNVETSVRNGYVLDPKQMIRVVDNLMDNSIRYTPEGKYVWLAGISAKKPLPNWVFPEFIQGLDDWRNDGTVIIIQNEGQGMHPSQINKVFQPFYQNEASRGKGATSGLGLSIAKMIMEKHEGKIKIWSIESKGTLIACWLKERGLS
ncbi:HAMP domain-containing histidine kinase [Oceanobacillus luteolus]|uniref:histidine kinase n=1 Tax=Oceanobacillus luteolus TaxID=1274358 RepID=A0ABW4HVH6_9BACI|nr:HAMP domain-containing sensor histidine kinase [Oceanobacillus luteolus]MCM3740812.1 HAMP domain-containing histidine kinase [Oceanobacillus luteolus]